jgi:tetratricopeptide (TPR) repeat protein
MTTTNINHRAVVSLLIPGIFLALLGCSTSAPHVRGYALGNSKITYPHLSQKEVAKFCRTIRPVQKDPEELFKLASRLQNLGMHRAAIESFNEIISAHPSYVKAHNGKGVSYDLIGYYSKAVKCYRRALEIDPDLDYAWNNLGYSHLLQGQLDPSIEAFQKAIKLNSDSRRYHNNLRLALNKKGLDKEAYSQFRLAPDQKRIHDRVEIVSETDKDLTTPFGTIKRLDEIGLGHGEKVAESSSSEKPDKDDELKIISGTGKDLTSPKGIAQYLYENWLHHRNKVAESSSSVKPGKDDEIEIVSGTGKDLTNPMGTAQNLYEIGLHHEKKIAESSGSEKPGKNDNDNLGIVAGTWNVADTKLDTAQRSDNSEMQRSEHVSGASVADKAVKIESRNPFHLTEINLLPLKVTCAEPGTFNYVKCKQYNLVAAWRQKSAGKIIIPKSTTRISINKKIVLITEYHNQYNNSENLAGKSNSIKMISPIKSENSNIRFLVKKGSGPHPTVGLSVVTSKGPQKSKLSLASNSSNLVKEEYSIKKLVRMGESGI